MTIKIQHGIFKLTLMQENLKYGYDAYHRRCPKINIIIPISFWDILLRKKNKWLKQGYFKYPIDVKIAFTHGWDEKTGIQSIAIVHPTDHFNRKIGVKIVSGRIKKALAGEYTTLPSVILI